MEKTEQEGRDGHREGKFSFTNGIAGSSLTERMILEKELKRVED